ncbi:MAG: alpha/beta hydrolase [Betaproteobacteria bacterium]|nr:MAG: alpha/beta hydrolase [Betaproteobacteria bacterium]
MVCSPSGKSFRHCHNAIHRARGQRDAAFHETWPIEIERRFRIFPGVAGAGPERLIVLTASSYRHDIAAARARVSSGSRIVETPCGSIEYAVIGKGAPVLVVHGAGGGFDQGLEFGRPLADRGFMVIAPSRFGYLRTSVPADASPAAQADAHARLLDALKLPKVIIFGGSAGAPSTIEFCLRHAARCSAVVLLVPAVFPPRRAGEPQYQPPAPPRFVPDWMLGSDLLFWLNLKLARDIALERRFAVPVRDFESAPPDEQERILRVMRNTLPLSQRRKGLRNDLATVASPRHHELERIAVPTLVIAIENDLFGIYESSRDVAQRIPGARFVGFPTGGHLWVGRQNEVISEVTAFLNRREHEKPRGAR